MKKTIGVTVWNEFRHEKMHPEAAKLYPCGMHAVIERHLNEQEGICARSATLDEAENGLPNEVLNNTDVLIWWGHIAHAEVEDRIVDGVQEMVLNGMGLICLHSAHQSKIFKRMMGTSCDLNWREAGEKERIWNIEPGHPIADGIGDCFELPHVEMYGERFDIPNPDALIFLSWFEGGEVFRSGCCWERGHGRIFYFRPGHETMPVFYDDNVMKVLLNAVRWAAPRVYKKHACLNVPPMEGINSVTMER